MKNKKIYLFGFSKWKRNFIKPFFPDSELIFVEDYRKVPKNVSLYIWGMKDNIELLNFCKENFIKISKVEDGFIRSISLGSDLTRPYSLIVDSSGIYIDPRTSSDLENILQNSDFDAKIKDEAKKLVEKILENKFSKYNSLSHKNIKLHTKENQKIILIPAQVEDDASMIYGGLGFDTLKLLQTVRQNNQDAFIIYKTHPDVVSGNRKGLKDKNIILKYCDIVLEDISIDSAISLCDEVHTITSTAGFDALLRNKKVFTYGMPFYAGWGLTNDFNKCTRRTKVLDLYSLCVGVFLLYPKYVSPKTKKLCSANETLDELLELQNRYFNHKSYRIIINLKTYILRKIRRCIEFVLQK